MARNTKEKILEVALDLFSQKGFALTNLQEIADNVGVVKSALYRHFKNKDELWNILIDTIEKYYDERMGNIANAKIPTTCKELEIMTLKMVDFTIHDEKIVKVRRILIEEQFKDERVMKLATKHFNEEMEALFVRVFKGMIQNESLKEDNPEILSFIYTAPISSLIQLVDRQKEKEGQVMKKMEDFIKHFIVVYGKK